MELLTDRQPGTHSEHTAQECHHVETCGYNKTVTEQHCEQALYLRTQLNKSNHIFISSMTLWLVLKILFFQLNLCQLLYIKVSASLFTSPPLYQFQDIALPKTLFSKALGKKCLKTSLTFRLSLKMTLPSTIACGNIVRPTLNFNWYAVPESSRGNYHSVHNKSHNKHLENDFIIHSASIKVSNDPSETHTWCTDRNRDEMKTILCIW